jgi:hypothetical protein
MRLPASAGDLVTAAPDEIHAIDLAQFIAGPVTIFFAHIKAEGCGVLTRLGAALKLNAGSPDQAFRDFGSSVTRPAEGFEMRVLTWNLALGTWLIISCFVLPQTAPSIIVTYAASVIVLAAAIAALGKPAARYVVTAAALALAIFAVTLADLSWAARVSDLLTAALLFVSSLMSPRRARWEGEESTPVTPHGQAARAG